MQPILKHGIMAERQAELLTDGILDGIKRSQSENQQLNQPTGTPIKILARYVQRLLAAP